MDNSKKLPSNKREKVVAPNLKKQNLFALFSLVMWQ